MTEPLFAGLEEHGQATALVGLDGSRISYAELGRMADEAAAPLGEERLLVSVEMSNTVDAIALYIGALRRRHVVIPTSGTASAIAAADTLSPNAAWLHAPEGPRLTLFGNAPPELHCDPDIRLDRRGEICAPVP